MRLEIKSIDIKDTPVEDPFLTREKENELRRKCILKALESLHMVWRAEQF